MRKGPKPEISSASTLSERMSSMAKPKHFVVRSDTGWNVIREGDRRPTARTDTRQAALAKARQLSRSEGGDVRVLGRSGKIVRNGVAGREARRAH